MHFITINKANSQKSQGFTRSDAGVGEDERGASVEGWLQVDMASSETAGGMAASMDEEDISFGIWSTLSSSFPGVEALNQPR